MFLEAEGSLASSLAWQQLQPARGTLVDGIARLPRQLIGSDPGVPSTVEAQQNARVAGDLLRRFRELGERMRQEYQAPPRLGEDEAALRVRGAGVVLGVVGGRAVLEAVRVVRVQVPASVDTEDAACAHCWHPPARRRRHYCLRRSGGRVWSRTPTSWRPPRAERRRWSRSLRRWGRVRRRGCRLGW